MAERGCPGFLYEPGAGRISAPVCASLQACRISGSLEADFSVSVQKINNPDPSQGCHGSARGLLEIWSAFSNFRGANS